jgi:ABC-2 type transport system permease protein
MFLVVMLILTKIIPAESIVFLTLDNAGLFLWYFMLGYLLSASIFAGMGALSSVDRHLYQFTQFIRILSVFPIALVILVLMSPNSILVRFLSFIPFLTPTFMILRTPLGQPPSIDYYISSGIMIAAILFFLFVSGKIFRTATLTRYPKRSLKGILEFLHAK